MPRNFSWLEVNRLAGSSCPTSELEIRSLIGVGIQHLVTLSVEAQPPIQLPEALAHTVIPITDRKGAKMSDFKQFFELCDQTRKSGAVCVHCRSGRGRTGMFLAAYLMKYKDLAADQAIATVRSTRPHSIETREQEEALRQLRVEMG